MKNNNLKENLKLAIDSLEDSKLEKILDILNLNPKKDFNYKDIKTFEDVCQILGTTENDFNLKYSNLDLHVVSYIKLTEIYKAVNNGWVPDWSNSNQYKYYPWFVYKPNGDGSKGSGCFGFDISYYNSYYANATVGSRFCTETSDKAKYIGETFIDIYNDYLLIK